MVSRQNCIRLIPHAKGWHMARLMGSPTIRIALREVVQRTERYARLVNPFHSGMGDPSCSHDFPSEIYA